MNKRCISLGISFLMIIILVFSFAGCGKKVVEPKYESDERFRFFAYLAPIPGDSEFGNKEDYINETQYGYIRDGGFTDAIAMYERNDDDAMRALAAAEATGVNYYVRNNTLYGSSAHPIEDLSILDTMFDRYKDEPAFVGNYGDDEAPATKFPYLKTVKDKYEEILPDKDLLINLLPTYATTAQLGADSYEEYIRLFAEKVRPEYIMFDHYPITCDEQRNVMIMSDFLYNLEVVAKECKRRGIPMRTFVQSLAYGHLPRDIDEDDIVWQINTHLAYGTSGILYFTYWTPLESHRKAENVNINEREALITKDGRRTEKYYAAKKIHEQIHRFEELYFSFQWQGAKGICGQHSSGTEKCFEKLTPFELPDRMKIQSEYECLAGCFQSERGEKGVFIVNFADPGKKYSNQISIKLPGKTKIGLIRNGDDLVTEWTGECLQIVLGCGESVFLHW